MFLKIVVVFTIIAFTNAGYLEPALRYAAPVSAISYQPAPLVSYTSPAITKTDFIPGSYSSSYRSDVITPRVKYTETPAISFAVPQPTIAVAPVARVATVAHAAPFVPALPAIAPAPLAVARAGFGLAAPLTHGLAAPLAHGLAAPLAHGLAAPLAHGLAAPLAHGLAAPLAHGLAAPLAHGLTAPLAHGLAAPLAHGFAGHAGLVAPLSRGYGW